MEKLNLDVDAACKKVVDRVAPQPSSTDRWASAIQALRAISAHDELSFSVEGFDIPLHLKQVECFDGKVAVTLALDCVSYETYQTLRKLFPCDKRSPEEPPLSGKPRDEMLKWAGAHGDKLDVWSFAQEHSVSYHSMLRECQGLVDDGYLWPLQESLAACRLTPKGEAAVAALL